MSNELDWNALEGDLLGAPAVVEQEVGVAASVLEQKLKGITAQLSELEGKRLDVNAHYAVPDGRGGQVIDHVAIERDKVTSERLGRELLEVRAQLGSSVARARQFGEAGDRAAIDFLRKNLPGVARGLQEQVKGLFIESFKQLKQQGYFERPENQSAASIANLVSSLFDASWGRAQREAKTVQAGTVNREPGLEAPPEVESEAPEYESDPAYQAIMSAFERTQGRGLSVAEQRRAAREAGQ